LRIFPDEDLEVNPMEPPVKPEPIEPEEPPAQAGLLFS
jgi:hypothetical protein